MCGLNMFGLRIVVFKIKANICWTTCTLEKHKKTTAYVLEPVNPHPVPRMFQAFKDPPVAVVRRPAAGAHGRPALGGQGARQRRVRRGGDLECCLQRSRLQRSGCLLSGRINPVNRCTLVGTGLANMVNHVNLRGCFTDFRF